MGIGGSLMTGWTFLLLWAVRKPVERRVVILITAFPVVFGMFIISFIEVLYGSTFTVWLLIKTGILIISMISSYILAGKVAGEKE
jgi:exosortase/archaeosortase